VEIAQLAWIHRPDVLSSGSIQLALSVFSLAVAVLLLLSNLSRHPARARFASSPVDLFFAASLAVALVSFVAAAKARESVLQPYTAVTAFAVYLLVRTNRHRVAGARAARLATLLVALAGIEAVHGLAQLAAGGEMKGFFFNVNHLAMFLAMTCPLAWVLTSAARSRIAGSAGYALNALLLAAIGLSRCRTAWLALLVTGAAVFLWPRLHTRTTGRRTTMAVGRAVRNALFFGAAALAVVAALAVSFKPESAAGRLLIWKVSLRTALAHPLAGVGYGNFPAVYSLEQGRYFDEGKGTATERRSAEAKPYAFNDYLESVTETGLLGLLVLVPLWGLSLRAAGRALGRAGSQPQDRETGPDIRLAAGAAGSVLAYMVVAGFYYPRAILPLALLFPALLGWIAGDERPASGGSSKFSRAFVLVFGSAALAAAIVLLPAAWRGYAAERAWSDALALDRQGRTGPAADASRIAFAGLPSNTDLIDFHARVLLKDGRPAEAAAVLERAGTFSSEPRLAEALAAARLQLGQLDGALESARTADAVLPWRLTPKSLLAGIYLKKGDAAGARRYARLVIDTPMKVRTKEGESLKAAAVGLWERPGTAPTGSPLLDLALEIPAQYRGGVLGALQAMGTGSASFAEALRAADPEERTYLAFLLANMPDHDVATLEAGYLVENVRLARMARRTIPLAAGVPDDIFLDYVLPYAAMDEPRDPWRADFYRRFRATAIASPSVEEAAVRFNRDVFVEFRLIFEDRDMRRTPRSPVQAIARRSVSCAEASILLVDACRAVGIPARLAVLRKWPAAASGHVWFEVWANGRWYHLTALDPTLVDETWIAFELAAQFRAGTRGAVFAPRFRRTGLLPLAGRDVRADDISERYLK